MPIDIIGRAGVFAATDTLAPTDERLLFARLRVRRGRIVVAIYDGKRQGNCNRESPNPLICVAGLADSHKLCCDRQGGIVRYIVAERRRSATTANSFREDHRVRREEVG